MIRDNSGNIHVTYCASSEPFDQRYAPNWGEGAKYATDMISHQQSRNNGITWSRANPIVRAIR